MLIPISTGKVITKGAKDKILNRQFSQEQLYYIYNEIVNDKENSKITFISDAVVGCLALGFIFYQATEGFKDITLFYVITFGIFYFILLAVFYYGCFKMQTNRFKKFVSKGYPELKNTFK